MALLLTVGRNGSCIHWSSGAARIRQRRMRQRLPDGARGTL